MLIKLSSTLPRFRSNLTKFYACSFVAALSIVATTAFSQNADPEKVAAELARIGQSSPVTMDIITSLTTEVGPRQAGTDAEKRAAAWAKQLFEKYGFDKVWTEPFPLEHGWMRGIEKGEVMSPSPQPLVLTALGSSVATPPEGIEAEIVVFRNYNDLLAAPTNSLKGKIAVVTQPMGRAADGGGYGAANKIRTSGPSEAARRGAIAYLHRSLGTDSHRIAHTGQTTYPEDAPKIPAAALSVPDAMQLDRLAAKGGPVRVKIVLTPRVLGPVTSQNVVAEIRGREKPDEVVLLGAHLDSWDLGTGAIDDGAGVAIISAAAKLIHDLPQRPKRTIRVVLFGSEEVGLFGGKAYAEAHKADLNHIIITAEPDSGQGPILHFRTGVKNPDDPSLVRIRAALAPLNIEAGNNQARGSSDVEYMVAAGVPAAGMDMQGEDYFDIHHTPDDTLDKISPQRINQSTAAYAVFAYLAAELGADYRAGAVAK